MKEVEVPSWDRGRDEFEFRLWNRLCMSSWHRSLLSATAAVGGPFLTATVAGGLDPDWNLLFCCSAKASRILTTSTPDKLSIYAVCKFCIQKLYWSSWATEQIESFGKKP